tara:strand:- start:1343 stop:1519 length:177 start_codon:yes stop_codon:yes gene_type:complete
LLEASQVSFNSIPINLRTMNDQERFENAELTNGRWAMIGIISALGAYAFTGQIIPGVF